MKSKKIILLIALIAFAGSAPLNSWGQKKVEVIQTETEVAKQASQGKTLKRKVAIGRFSNETEYGKGLFYDKDNDPMAKQALDILSTKLAETGKFILLERSDSASIMNEVSAGGGNLSQKIGADYVIIGSITEFGRKNTGRQRAFSNQKTQTVEAGVSIRLVDVSTGMIIYSEEGKGSAEITTKESIFGTGGKAGYDATLSDKAITAAISQLVENIVNKCTDKPWKTYFLMSDADATIIGGGKSQGLEPGMSFAIMTKGKKVKNPQTGMTIELPGKQIGTVQIVSTGGDTPETEYSIVNITKGSIDASNLQNYYIQEIK